MDHKAYQYGNVCCVPPILRRWACLMKGVVIKRFLFGMVVSIVVVKGGL